jgi:hypothetical protein
MRTIPLACLLLFSSAAHAAATDGGDFADADHSVTSSVHFLDLHPDLQGRRDGLAEMEKGRPELAIGAFRRAARYADKPSQSMLGELHWIGNGTAVDRALGYVWMDLAAERGYPLLVAKREHYWRSMNDAERARALEIGPELYAEFGDDVARPRLARQLRQGLREITGSRVGHVGNLQVVVSTNATWDFVTGDNYYDRKYWQPEMYFAWQDETWNKHANGVVDVGPVAVPTGGAAPRGDD